MNKQLPRHEVLAAFAVQNHNNSRDGAARDLLRAAADLLKDSDEGIMAERLAMLLALESGNPHAHDQNDILGCVDEVHNLAHNLGERFEAAFERVAA